MKKLQQVFSGSTQLKNTIGHHASVGIIVLKCTGGQRVNPQVLVNVLLTPHVRTDERIINPSRTGERIINPSRYWESRTGERIINPSRTYW